MRLNAITENSGAGEITAGGLVNFTIDGASAPDFDLSINYTAFQQLDLLTGPGPGSGADGFAAHGVRISTGRPDARGDAEGGSGA